MASARMKLTGGPCGPDHVLTIAKLNQRAKVSVSNSHYSSSSSIFQIRSSPASVRPASHPAAR